jgi:hypothetical protein
MKVARKVCGGAWRCEKRLSGGLFSYGAAANALCRHSADYVRAAKMFRDQFAPVDQARSRRLG